MIEQRRRHRLAAVLRHDLMKAGIIGISCPATLAEQRQQSLLYFAQQGDMLAVYGEVADGAIRRTYKTDGWRGSMLVANAIAFICEAADHHADLTVTWPTVSVALSTHSAKGITAKDFEVARLVERQVLWRPGEESDLTGPSKPFVTGD